MPGEDNDRQFEQELRDFAPLEVAPLPRRSSLARRRWLSAAVAALVLLTIGIALLWRPRKSVDSSLASHGLVSMTPITLGESHAALLRAASFDAAIDQLEREGRFKQRKTAH